MSRAKSSDRRYLVVLPGQPLAGSQMIRFGSAKKATRRVASWLARPERFELPTFWFVARHSIQLSYGRLEGAGIIEVGVCRCQADGDARTSFASPRHGTDTGGGSRPDGTDEGVVAERGCAITSLGQRGHPGPRNFSFSRRIPFSQRS